MFVKRKFYPERTKVIFFDLEYFVPHSDRNRDTPSGMRFSPHMDGHKVLGGCFLTYFPLEDRIGKRCAFWEWSVGDERSVLTAIYKLLEAEWKSYSHPTQAGALMLAGIGISHSDVPCLMARTAAHRVAEEHRLYDVIYGCRQLDLSVATFCQFSFNKRYYSFPKKKSELYQKYVNGKRMDSGKSVWDAYESRDFSAIEDRCAEEVDDCLAIYKAMFDLKTSQDSDLKRLRRLESTNLREPDQINSD